MRSAAPRTRLALGAVAAALALTACTGGSTAEEREQAELAERAPSPAPVEALPTPIQTLVASTDVGQYLVQPGPDVPAETVQQVIARLRTMEGVQSAELREDGFVDLVFAGDPSAEARTAAVRQLAVLGDPVEGI